VPSTHYELYSRGFKIDLANIGKQESLEVRFPLFRNNEYRDLLNEVYWTDHLNWISWQEIETERDAQTGEELFYYKIVFNLVPPGG